MPSSRQSWMKSRGSAPDVGPLRGFVERAGGRVLLVHDRGQAELASAVPGEPALLDAAEDFTTLPPRRWAAVGLVASDAASLRRLVSALPRLGRTRSLLLWLTEADQPVISAPRPDWSAVTSLTARRAAAGGAVSTLSFERAILANAVFEELARASVPGRDSGNGGLWIASAGVPVPADPSALRVSKASDASDSELTVPPDVVLATGYIGETEVHHVIDRAPVLVEPNGLMGPIDERVLNPSGFLARVDGGSLGLSVRGGRLNLSGDGVEVTAELERGATAAMVTAARPHRDVVVDWDSGGELLAPTVVGLAAAGVPMATRVPQGAEHLVAGPLRQALADSVDLDDPLRREEHSVLARRAAQLEHNTRGWRGRLAESAGTLFRRFPTVSVLLATRRPEMLDFALRQVAKQRGIELELVLATHGFEVDRAAVRRLVPDYPVHAMHMPAEAFFGDVLNAALAKASGDLVTKMDDDDWYGPDFLLDLLLAREYTGADLVGTTVENVYLVPLHTTVRRNDESERVVRFVAGGSTTIERSTLKELGGFRRVRRYVDAQLLDAVLASGGQIYRGHGLGYMLRRNDAGHTWDPGLDYYLDEDRLVETWPGFVTSRILTTSRAELPTSQDL